VTELSVILDVLIFEIGIYLIPDYSASRSERVE
jgi:hypothetical protein